MGNLAVGWKKLPVKNPVDNALFLFASDINLSRPETEICVNLSQFRSDAIKQERIKPLEFVRVTVGKGKDEKDLFFNSLKEVNSFFRDMAKDAPSLTDGAISFPVYMEWKNKHEAMFKGFTMHAGSISVCKEMENTPNILEHFVMMRDMYDAGLVFPNSMSQEQLKKHNDMIQMFPDDKDYLVMSMLHCEGLNGQTYDLSKAYENVRDKQKSALRYRVPERTQEQTQGRA